MNRRTLTPRSNTKLCISDMYLKEVIRFIMRDDHVQMLSWGSRRIKYNEKTKVSPDIIRKWRKKEYGVSFEREVLKKNISSYRSNLQGMETRNCDMNQRHDGTMPTNNSNGDGIYRNEGNGPVSNVYGNDIQNAVLQPNNTRKRMTTIPISIGKQICNGQN